VTIRVWSLDRDLALFASKLRVSEVLGVNRGSAVTEAQGCSGVRKRQDLEVGVVAFFPPCTAARLRSEYLSSHFFYARYTIRGRSYLSVPQRDFSITQPREMDQHQYLRCFSSHPPIARYLTSHSERLPTSQDHIPRYAILNNISNTIYPACLAAIFPLQHPHIHIRPRTKEESLRIVRSGNLKHRDNIASPRGAIAILIVCLPSQLTREGPSQNANGI
jgi:hypothetical protein